MLDLASLPDRGSLARRDTHTGCVPHRNEIVGDKTRVSRPGRHSCGRLYPVRSALQCCHFRLTPLRAVPFPESWLDSQSRHRPPPAAGSVDIGAALRPAPAPVALDHWPLGSPAPPQPCRPWHRPRFARCSWEKNCHRHVSSCALRVPFHSPGTLPPESARHVPSAPRPIPPSPPASVPNALGPHALAWPVVVHWFPNSLGPSPVPSLAPVSALPPDAVARSFLGATKLCWLPPGSWFHLGSLAPIRSDLGFASLLALAQTPRPRRPCSAHENSSSCDN